MERRSFSTNMHCIVLFNITLHPVDHPPLRGFHKMSGKEKNGFRSGSKQVSTAVLCPVLYFQRATESPHKSPHSSSEHAVACRRPLLQLQEQQQHYAYSAGLGWVTEPAVPVTLPMQPGWPTAGRVCTNPSCISTVYQVPYPGPPVAFGCMPSAMHHAGSSVQSVSLARRDMRLPQQKGR